MNLLVGATGFVGGHLVEYLFQQGEISKGTFRMGSHLKIMDASGVQGLEADLLDHHSLHEAMEGVDCVYSLASPRPGSGGDFRVNTEGVLNLLEVAVESKVKSFVHLSALEVHGFSAGTVAETTPLNPGNEYQRSKAEAERLLGEFARRNQTPRVVIIRSARAFGSRDPMLAGQMLKAVHAGKVILPKGGVQSYSHPLDISQALYKAALGTSPTGSVFLLKSFDASPRDLAQGLATELSENPEIKNAGMFSGPSVSGYAAEQLAASIRIDFQQSWAALGYAPLYDLKKSCAEVANWYKREPWSIEEA